MHMIIVRYIFKSLLGIVEYGPCRCDGMSKIRYPGREADETAFRHNNPLQL